MQTNIMYHQSNHMEWIYYQDIAKYYPVHTHASHITVGYVLDGIIRIVRDSEEFLCHAGERYCIMPDVPHGIEPYSVTYSMISICMPVGKAMEKSVDEIHYTKRLKQRILNAPEDTLFIDEMAHHIGVSPYHLIRQFRSSCGLTPHQFQIQCRVRMAQKLLAEGKSVIEAAYATGFYDQSHLDRCFRKVVCLTPREYQQSVK